STFMAGADAPAAAAPAAPAVVAGCGAGCDTCDSCGKKPGILDKLKGRLGCHKHKRDCCAPAPTCCEKPAPAPTCCAPAPAACDTCAARPNLLDKIKGKLHGRKSKDCCAPACDGCAPAPVPGPVVPPKPMDPKKAGTDAAPSIAIPTPGATNVPTIPVTPVSGPKLTGAGSP